MRACVVILAVLPWLVAPALAAEPAGAGDGGDRLDRFERRLDELEDKYNADLKSRDEEIARLRAELERLKGQPPAPRPPAPPAGTADDVDQTTEDILSEIESGGTAPPAATGRDDGGATTQLPPPPRVGASFTPDIAVITDAVGTYSPDRENDAYNRFDIREVELDLRAPVHPKADAVAIFAFERDVENPIFAEAEGGEEEEGGGPESSTGVEEAYLFLHDLGVQNLTAKLGRFHLRFGRQNLLHLHDLPTTDPPFVNQAFLAPEALIDSGISLSYILPSRIVGDQYVEVIAEVVTGEGADSESPTLQGDLSVDSPAVNTHVLWNTDIARDWNLELGGSWLTAHGDADNRRDVNLFGADVTLIRTDPTGGFRNSILQAEAIYGVVDDEERNAEESFGVYLLGQQQLNRDWYAGLRLDWTQNPADADQEAWGVTPYVSWYWSDFLRFRASYQHRDGDREDEDIFYLQATWLFGAHPPHPYWSMR